MTIEDIRAKASAWDEVVTLNRSFESGDCQLSAAALTRCGNKASLWLVQYDGTFLERVDEAEAQAWRDPAISPATNRDHLLQRPGVGPHLLVEGLTAVRLGAQEYPIKSSSHTHVHSEDWNTVLTLYNLLRAGWEPGELSEVNMENLVLSEYELRDALDALPPGDGLTLLPHDRQDEEVVAIERTLTFDGDAHPQRLELPDGTSAWLIRGEWFDPWKHLEDTLSHPRIKAQFTPQEIEQHRQRMETEMEQLCSRGEALPVAVYEAEPEVSLYFYESSWLGQPYKPSSSAFGVFGLGKNREKTGPHGLPLHTAALTECSYNPAVARPLTLGLMRWTRRRPQAPVRG